MDNLVRVAIVGAGNFSKRRIYPYISSAGGKIVGICTRSLDSSKEVAELYGCKQYTDIDELIDTENPDCVIICTGPSSHPQIAAKVMKHGIPVYTEKPQSMTYKESIEMAEVSKSTDVLCSIAYKKRYASVYKDAKDWIKTFPVEKLSSVSIDCSSGPFKNEDQESSFLHGCGIHIIDLVVFLFGEVDTVYCVNRGDRAYAISLKFQNGAIGTLTLCDTGSMTVPTEEVEIHIEGQNFMRIHNCSEYKICESGIPTKWREPSTFMSSGDSGNDTGLLAELLDFFDAVKNTGTTVSNIFESSKSVLLYEAIIESSVSGKIVTLDYSELNQVCNGNL
ncbi:MAG: Gfo/Idh/MocA family oxidoreductase [Spirochaetales bacterium]